jgi:VWFA-related protein
MKTVALLFAVLLQATAAPQDPQRPTFRSGVNLVRVDAYPTKDGQIIEGLTAEDFEVLEDGVPQKIDTFQFVRYDQNTAAGERRDPNSQRDAFQLAADPSYRVFVIYLDNRHLDVTDSHRIRSPIVTLLQRILGPRDLFGVMTTMQEPRDLILGQQSLLIEEQLTRYWDWGSGGRVTDDPEELALVSCFAAQGKPEIGNALVQLRRLDEVFRDLEGLTHMLGGLRDERKNILLISNGWVLPRETRVILDSAQPQMPGIGVSGEGKLTMGSRRPGEPDSRWCQSELQRLTTIDFQQRQRDAIRLAREANVTYYSIRPVGLAAPASVGGMRAETAMSDSIRELSDNTDGIAIVNTNDLTGAARKVADDLTASYILGYYSTNTKADGRVRKITVRLKGSKAAVRARREYRAATTAEMTEMREVAAASAAAASAPVSAVETALAELKRLRPEAVLHSRGAIVGDELVLTSEIAAIHVEAGRWKTGAEAQAMVSAASGEVMTAARATLDPASRAVVFHVPLNGAPGPFTVAIRLRNATDGEATDSISVTRPSGTFGDAMLFRLPLPNVVRPAASPQFRRTERIRIRWPILRKGDSPVARVLGRDGKPIDLAVTVSERAEAGMPWIVADLNLAPLTAGEYVIEVRAGDSVADVAIRVMR